MAELQEKLTQTLRLVEGQITIEEWQAESDRIKAWQKQAQTYRCAVCHAGLVVRWNSEKGLMELACSQDKTHQGIEAYSESKERLRRFQMAETKALAIRPRADLTKEVQAKWPKDLVGPQAEDFIKVCLAYGFDPLLGELIPFQGRPYITLDARLRRAQKHPAWGGWLPGSMRPATKEEKEGRGYDPGDIVAVVQVIRKGTEQPLVFGRVSVEEREKQRKTEMERYATARAPLVLDPYAMAEKRAMHKALRQGFADTIGLASLPGLEEELSSVNGDAEPLEDAQAEAPAQDAPEGPQEPQGVASGAKPAVVLGTKNYDGFWKAALALGYGGPPEISAVLGIRSGGLVAWCAGGKTLDDALEVLRQHKKT